MLKFACCCLAVLCLAGRSTAQVQNIPEVDSFRYDFMYYSVYDDLNGYVTKGRVRPVYTMGVVDTIYIDSPIVQLNEWVRKWRIRYEPLSLTPTKRYMEQFNGAYVRTETDSFVYEHGLRTQRYTQVYVDGIPWEYRRSLYEYDSVNRFQVRTDEVFTDDKWHFVRKREYHYDDLGQVVGILDSTLRNGKLNADTREIWDYFEFTIDEVTRQGFKLGPQQGGTWYPIERFSYFGVEKRTSKQFVNATDTLEFDTLTSHPQTRTFVFTNPVEEPISVTGVSYGVGQNFQISGLPAFPFTMFPGESREVTVTFLANDRSTATDSLSILVDEIASQVVYLMGRARKGSLALSSVALDFGTIKVDSSGSIDLTFSNIGDATIGIDSIVSGDRHFTSAAFIPVNLNESMTLSAGFNFRPTDSMRYETTYRVYYHNHLGQFDTIITAVGNGFKKPDSVLSVDPDQNVLIFLSPNPANSFIRLDAKGLDIRSGYLQTITGESIEIPLRLLQEGYISTETLPAGMARFVLETSGGMISKKLMIVR
jgi:hypothetical protein